MRGDYRSTDLAGAERAAAILAGGVDLFDEPLPDELVEDLELVGEVDGEIRDVFDEIYGQALAVADLPF